VAKLEDVTCTFNMTTSKRYQELNRPYMREKGFLPQDGTMSSSVNIIKLLLTSIYLVLPWRGIPFDEERPRSRRLQRG
jgi:hypothetical protein